MCARPVLLVVLLLISAFGCGSKRAPTEEKFQKVKEGMLRNEVEAIVGKGSKSANPIFTAGTVQHTNPDGTVGTIQPGDILEWRDAKGGALGDRFFIMMFAKDKVVSKTTYEPGQ